MSNAPKLPPAPSPEGHGPAIVSTIKLRLGSARAPSKKKATRPASKAKPEPDGAPDYVFLPRAVQHVGQATFGKEWMPELNDRTPPRPIVTWSEDVIDMFQAEQVATVLRKMVHDAVPGDDVSKGGLNFDTAWVEHLELWELAQTRRAEEIAHIELFAQQIERSRTLLVQAMRAGSVKTFTRAVAGGGYTKKDRAFWNFEDWHERVITGKFSRARPYQKIDEWKFPATDYIFVSKVGLEREFSIHALDSPDLNWVWDKLSPCMRVVLRAAVEIARSGKQPNSEKLKARLKHLASIEPAELTGTLTPSLATIIRSEEARRGVKGADREWDPTGATPLWQPYGSTTK